MATTAPRKSTAAKPAAKKPAAKRAAAKKAAAAKPAPRKKAPAKPNGAAAVAAVPAKPPKAKLVRDSFTMPKPEYLVIDELKRRGMALAHPLKKSELLRAGIKALAAMSDAEFLAAVKSVPPIKTGRPKSGKKPNEPAAAE
jgi:hypothetical protein